MSDITNKKQGGIPNPNVDMRNGKVDFSVPLFTISTSGGAEINLLLRYESALLLKLYETWNREVNTGLVAAGWNLNIGDQIFTVGEGSDIFPYLFFKGTFYSLELLSVNGSHFTYKTAPASNYKVEFLSLESMCILYDEYGIKYIFGKDDAANQETGAYNKQTGTYAQASEEYEKVRLQISNPGADNNPINGFADNTICTSREIGILWSDWSGPSMQVSGQSQRVTAWKLSHIEDAFGNKIVFSYIHHISTIVESVDSRFYTVCSYLYRIRVMHGNIETEKITFDYRLKSSGEYNLDFDLYKRPNGVQYRFQKLYLTDVSHSRFGVADKNYRLLSEMIDTWEEVGGICKRQLKEIQIFDSNRHNAMIEAGYIFEYYGRSDGVSISREGFTEYERKYNAQKGALFGHIKKIIYPTGKIEIYTYCENTVASIQPEMIEQVEHIVDQRELLTPYDYNVIMRLFADGTITFSVYTWAISGWVKQELLRCTGTKEEFSSYNYESMTDFSDSVIVLTSISGSLIKVFRLSPKKSGLWIGKNLAPHVGVVVNVSVNEKRLAVCTAQAANEYVYPYVYGDNETYVSEGSVDITKKAGVTNYVCTACTADCWIVITLYKESYNAAPLQFGGKSIPFFKNVVRAFTISDNGKTSDLINVGYVPNAIIKTSFTTPAPPIVAEPIEYSIWATVGGNISSVKKIERRGKMLYLKLGQKSSVGCFGRNSITQEAFTRTTDETEWGICLQYDRHLKKFILVGEPMLRVHEYNDVTFYKTDIDSLQIPTSVAAAGNGVTYNYQINMKFKEKAPFSSVGTFEYIFDGIKVNSIKDFETKNYACMVRDNFFEAFYVSENNNERQPIFRRKYKYYDQKRKRFCPIETGAIDNTKITYNEQDAAIQTYLGYAGLALSILLLPFGMVSIFGLVMTSVCYALMIASATVQTLLNNSVMLSLDPNTTYYGNRFIADGSTIWFRENGQEKLSSLGKGMNFDSNDGIRGSVIVNKQMAGTVVNFIPFYTTSNALYYTILKNGKLKRPIILDGISEGITGFDFNPKYSNMSTVYKGDIKFTYLNKKLSSVSYVTFGNKSIFINAFLRIMSGSADTVIIFSGAYYYVYNEKNSILTPKQKILDGISKNKFFSIDAAIYEGWNTGTVQKAMLFNGSLYEQITIEGGKITVISTGTILSLGYPIPFDKLDSAAYIGNNKFIATRNGRYVIVDALAKSLVGQGYIGDYLQSALTPENTKLQFNYDVLTITKDISETVKLFSIKKFINGSLQSTLCDYTAHTISTFSNGTATNADFILTYEYDTYNSTFLEDAQSVGYRQINVWVEE